MAVLDGQSIVYVLRVPGKLGQHGLLVTNAPHQTRQQREAHHQDTGDTLVREGEIQVDREIPEVGRVTNEPVRAVVDQRMRFEQPPPRKGIF